MNIEEAIQILKTTDFTKEIDYKYPTVEYMDAIETLLNEYTRQVEINAEHQKLNGELREEIERYKRIANQKFDDLEEFRKNECEHRCIKNAEVLELKEYYQENYISKDKIIESLGKVFDAKDIKDSKKIINMIDFLVAEFNRLEDIEDRKVQIEYNNVFNKGVKSVEDKIKLKIENYNKELEHIENGEEFENEKPMYYWGKVALGELLEDKE